jgi:hypothetical protein
MYKLQGQVPETIMMGQTADISFICEFEQYSWVYYNESNIQFPKEKKFIGWYLGLMMAKILKSKVEVLRTNTFRHVRQEEFDTEECIKVLSNFIVALYQRLGDLINMQELMAEFDVAFVAPEYKVY